MATLKYWDEASQTWKYVALPGSLGEYVNRKGDVMSGPLVIGEDDAEASQETLLDVQGGAAFGRVDASAAHLDTIETQSLRIEGSQPEQVWVATDDHGNGEWRSLGSINDGFIIVSPTPPDNPKVGMAWWDTSKPEVSDFWVVMNPTTSALQTGTATGTAWNEIPTWPKLSIDVPCDGLIEVEGWVVVRPGVVAGHFAKYIWDLDTNNDSDLVLSTGLRAEGSAVSVGSAQVGVGVYSKFSVWVRNVPDGGSTVNLRRMFACANTTAWQLSYPRDVAHFIPNVADREVRLDWTP